MNSSLTKHIKTMFATALIISAIAVHAEPESWSAPLGLVKDAVFVESRVTNVTVNGSSVVDAQKIARVSVPVKVSQLSNDSGFVTSTVTNGILESSIDYTNQYTNQAPGYSTTSNLAENALQRIETNGVIEVSKDFTYESLTNTDINAFMSAGPNSIVGKISNSKVRITVDGTKMAVMDGTIERWSFDKDDMNGKQDLLPYPTNAIPASVIVGTVGAPDYENVSNKAVNALQKSETTDVIRVANDYADRYAGQAPDYANVSNLSVNALQRSETGAVIKVATDYADKYADQSPDYSTVSNLAVNALQKSETGNVIKVATDYADQYSGQAPDYYNVSNIAVNALQRSETGSVIKVATDYSDKYANQAPDYSNVSNLAINALQKSETSDVIKVATDYADRYANQAPDYDTVSNKAMTAIQSHQSLDNYLTKGETTDVIRVANDYADRYANQAPDYNSISNKAMTALQEHQSLTGYLPRSETGDVIKVATDYADANKVQKLVDITFDFENGSNFTKRVYEVLTNVIDRMGGSITNPPIFED